MYESGKNAEIGKINTDVKLLAYRLVFQLPGRVVQQAAIKLVPDRRNVPALLGPQNVSRAANFEVAHGDLEAGPQLAELFHRLEPPRGRRREALSLFQQQVAIRAVFVAADASAKLVHDRPARTCRPGG